MGRLHTDTLIALIVLMFIGGASAAVTGGITVNTFSVLFIAMVSHIRGRRYPEAFGRRIAQHSVMRALAVVGLSGAAVLLSDDTYVRRGARLRDRSFEPVIRSRERLRRRRLLDRQSRPI